MAVLLAPGNGGNRAGRAGLAEELSRRGLAVLLMDYRGYGGNPGRPSEDGLAADADAAVEALERLGYPTRRTLYLGESLGSGVRGGAPGPAPTGGNGAPLAVHRACRRRRAPLPLAAGARAAARPVPCRGAPRHQRRTGDGHLRRPRLGGPLGAQCPRRGPGSRPRRAGGARATPTTTTPSCSGPGWPTRSRGWRTSCADVPEPRLMDRRSGSSPRSGSRRGSMTSRAMFWSAAGCSTRARIRLAMKRAVRTGVPVRVTSDTVTIPRPVSISTRRPLRLATMS